MVIDEFKRNPKKFFILIGVVAVAVIVIVVIANMINPPPEPEEIEEEEELIYEVEIEDVRFKLEEVRDRGNVLKASESRYPKSIREDKVTTEKFIEVTIAVQNIGKENVQIGNWKVGGMLDSEEREFESTQYLDNWTPKGNKCAYLLKPGFSPVLCTRIYEVAKVSTGLKVEVSVERGKPFYIDLGI